MKEFKKKCSNPDCKNEIIYKSKGSLTRAIKDNTLCRSCCGKMASGENNPMYKKSFYDLWVQTYGKEIADEKLKQKMENRATTWKNKSDLEIELFKRKASELSKGKNNGMYNKWSYDVWLEKYGKEIADEKLKQYKEKQHINNSGKNNNMFGKPAPTGAGIGWSGYYKDLYFRSMLELDYLIYLIDNNINFESAEKKKYSIPYIMDGINRNYFPDFYLIDTQEIIEIKPKRLIDKNQNQLKFAAAKEKLGDKYVVLTEENIPPVKFERLYELYLSKELKFNKKYEQKFLEKYNKKVKKN